MRVDSVDWWLAVSYRNQTFEGKVRIAFEGAEDPLVLDFDRLSLDSSSVDGSPVTFVQDPVAGTITLSGVSPGAHTLEIVYRGAADPKSLVGMYVAPAGGSYVLTTMLFPTGSRRLLPAFEHPSVKTVYRLTLTTEADVHVVFNTPPGSQRTIGGQREWTFEPTPRMSAYLLYLGIGPFDTLTVHAGRWAVTVDASPGRASAGRYLAERAAEVLAAYEEYYGVPYPLPKLDLVALENFWAGAMENWGAIAFRDEAVLVGPSTGVRLRRAMLAVLAHEIAHQWFGNLVTNAWWDDFWLNESFANFVAYRIIARRYPEDEPWKSLLVDWVSAGLALDALESTHPVHVPVETPSQLGEHADMVTYGKGAAILRMMEAYLGEETFRRGISRYLERYQYSNARAVDLWNTLGEAAKEPVARIMTEWITRAGFPVVRIDWAEGRLRLQQRRFRADGSEEAGVWPIPLRVVGADGEHRLMFDGTEATLALPSPQGLRIDPGRTGFLRIAYEGELAEAMLREFPSMDPIDQWGMVDDLGAFVFSNPATFGRFLELLRQSTGLTDDLPIRGLISRVDDLRTPAYGVAEFSEAAEQFLKSQLDRIGLEPREGEPEKNALLRELISNLLARIDREFAQEMSGRYREFDRVPASLRLAVLIGHARTGGPEAFEHLVERIRTTSEASDRLLLLNALAEFESEEILQRVLALVPSPGISSSGAFILLNALSHNPPAGEVLFRWYREKVGALTEMWAGSPLQSEFLHGALVGMGLGREESLRAFVAEHTPADSVAGARHGLESLALAARLRRAIRVAHPGPPP